MSFYLTTEQAARIALECDNFEAEGVELSHGESSRDVVTVIFAEGGARVESFTVGQDGDLQ